MGTHSELARALDQVAELLRIHRVKLWPERLAAHAERVRSVDSGAGASVLREFSGMGSLNDVWIDPRNGNLVEADQVPVVNGRLDALRSEIYELAQRLHRESSGSPTA